MRRYEPKHPMEEIVIDNYHYRSLHKDDNGVVISENITCFSLGDDYSEARGDEATKRVMGEMELNAKQHCQKLEIAYSNSSGNRWVFLLFNGYPTKDELMQMKKAYEDLYDPEFIRWREQYKEMA